MLIWFNSLLKLVCWFVAVKNWRVFFGIDVRVNAGLLLVLYLFCFVLFFLPRLLFCLVCVWCGYVR